MTAHRPRRSDHLKASGADHGIGGWPAEWVRDIEYRDRLLALGAAWDI